MTTSFSLFLSRMSVLMLLLVAMGCQTRDDAVATPQTISDRILEDSQFSLFRLAMGYAGVGDALKSGNLTLFAPTDAAFQAAGLATEEAIRATPRDQLRTMLMYHVLYGRSASSAIPAGQNSVITANKAAAFVTKTTDGSIYINSAKLTQTDIAVANGYIHVIDRVLIPGTGNLLTTIQTNPNLTFLAAAIKRVGSSNPTLLATLDNVSATNPVTVFAPNDAAFKADKVYNTLAAIESANVQTLTNTLLYHVLSGVKFSTQFQSGSVATLLSGNTVTLTVAPNQLTVKGNKNSTSAFVKQADLTATNGVIHIIDQVLQP
ncbi:fasciclin domain-containing protein [Spirosoma sp. KCTC 42546]|uniref:fasciclin domain-containing protein n=1 Tax=Spirosoma sp. KCTC 42546 TaxID=2520506 RepID=UPI001158580D|nr:fasciclin domain-containing protein [Spirosoma sp. KCTC 42546]QDK78050.1 fasciclin domain-containing protein [Spirosoma sp. KCTC 42546]